jgi:hypothetical protein
MCEDIAPNFGDKKNWLLHDDKAPSHTFFFHEGIFDHNNMTVGPTHSIFFCFSD